MKGYFLMMDGNGEMMSGMGGMMGGMMGLCILTGVLLIGLMLIGGFFLLRGGMRGAWGGGKPDALQVLKGRLAAGDIDEAEYEQRRRLLAQP
jgi:uncharacterized membrane protein